MARLIKLTLFAAPFEVRAYGVDTIDTVQVVPVVPGIPGIPAHRDGSGNMVPATPSVPSIAEHAIVVFKGMTGSSVEVKENISTIVTLANA